MRIGLGLAASSIFCTSSAFIPTSPRRPGTYHKRTLLSSTEAKTSDNAETQFLLKEIEDLTATFVDVQKIIESNARLYESKLSEYEQQMDKLSNEISQANTIILQKELELEDMQKATEKSNGKDKDKKSTNKERKAMEKDLKSKKKEIETLSQQVQEKQMLLTEKEEHMTNIQQEVKTITADYETLKEEVTRQSDLVASTQAENEVLLEQVSNLQRQAEEAALQSQKLQNDHEIQINSLKDDMTAQNAASKEQDSLRLEEAQRETKKLEQTLSTVREELAAAVSKTGEETLTLQNKVRSLERELSEQNPNVQDVQLRKELIDVRAKSQQELMDVRLKMTSSKDKLQELTEQVERYEAERRSLRKLTFLGLRRVLTLVTFGLVGGEGKNEKSDDKKKQEPGVKALKVKRTKLRV